MVFKWVTTVDGSRTKKSHWPIRSQASKPANHNFGIKQRPSIQCSRVVPNTEEWHPFTSAGKQKLGAKHKRTLLVVFLGWPRKNRQHNFTWDSLENTPRMQVYLPWRKKGQKNKPNNIFFSASHGEVTQTNTFTVKTQYLLTNKK